MKKKYNLIILVAVIAVAMFNFYTNFNLTSEQDSWATSLLQLNVAHAEGAEYDDPTWQNIANWLETWDQWAGVKNAIGENTPTDQMFNAIHQYFDDWDITGDPEFEWVYDSYGNADYAQTDDCDGQPNFC